MKNPYNLSKKKLAWIVAQVQGILYLDIEEEKQVWNPDKQWDIDFLSEIADVIDGEGLVPSKLGEKEEALKRVRRQLLKGRNKSWKRTKKNSSASGR